VQTVTPWYVPVARGTTALVLAVVVTFTADHSAPLGYLTLGIFTVIAGSILAASALRLAAGRATRTLTLAQGLITVLVGIVCLSLPAGGLPFFVFLLTTFASITGFLELYVGLRGRGRDRSARDWVFIGGLTALLAIAVLLVPPELRQAFVGPDSVQRELTASVVIVGALGAYWAIFGMYLVIAGLSLKWAPAEDATASLSSQVGSS
jgi:uncharacterized membrane protein HdeD (DUF308 family)